LLLRQERRIGVADYTARSLDEIEAVYGGGFRRARASLGVTSFGMAVEELPPNSGDAYPEHDHSQDGQEEVYVVLAGSGEIEIDGEIVDLEPDTFIRVGPQARRRIRSSSEGLRILAIGAVPGKPYEPPAFTELGAH
jgi:mannose-6-phosphate isomerase-like protein (cupin superfamily)